MQNPLMMFFLAVHWLRAQLSFSVIMARWPPPAAAALDSQVSSQAWYAIPIDSAVIDDSLVPQEDLVLGKKMASGGFGTVYKAELSDQADPRAEPRDVILKKVGGIFHISKNPGAL